MFLRNCTAALVLLAVSASAQPIATVPYEAQKGVLFADFQVNGTTLNLAIDSGSTHCQLDLEVAKKLGINVDKVALSSGPHTQSGPREVRVAEGVVFEIGKARITPPAIVVYSLAFLSARLGRPVNGIVGSAIFRDYVVAFDYSRQILRLLDPATFQAPATARSIPVDVRPNNLFLRGQIVPAPGLPPVEGIFELDTGVAGVEAVLWKPCSENPAVATNARVTREVEATAFGGNRKEREARVAKLIIGDAVIDNPLIRLSDSYVSGDRPSEVCANFGMDVLKRFNIIVDLPHRRLLIP